MKSSCLIQGEFTYDQAETACRIRNMELFVIDARIIQERFQEAMTEDLILDTENSMPIWINGKRKNGEWLSYSPEKSRLYHAVHWVKTATINGQTSGTCLKFLKDYGSFKSMGADCNDVALAICEFRQAPVLNIQACWKKTEIFDEKGTFKTACIINTDKTYWEASQICKQNGMQLFVISDWSEEVELRKFGTRVSLGYYWINGRRDLKTKKWFTYDPKSPLYELIDWSPDCTPRSLGDEGDCLLFTSEFSRFVVNGADCQVKVWFICEY